MQGWRNERKWCGDGETGGETRGGSAGMETGEEIWLTKRVGVEAEVLKRMLRWMNGMKRREGVAEELML